MRKILIELQIDWEGYEDVSDELIVEDAIDAKVEGVGWALLRQPPVSGSLLFSQKDIEKKLDALGLNGKYIASHFKSNDR